MSLLPPSKRPGETVILPGAPRDFSIKTEDGWALVKDGRLWKAEAETPLEAPLFSKEGLEIAPGLSVARSLTDATLLKGEVSEVRGWAEQMSLLDPRTVCVFPAFLGQVRDLFLEPAVVISFPHGADSTKSKLAQIEEAILEGAKELDVVAPLRLINGSSWKEFAREMRALAPYKIKLILETSLWREEQIIRASKEALEAGVWCLKTSTGSKGGASAQAISAMKKAGADEIKASGGIRSREIAGEMLRAGATMLGSSNLEEWV